MTVQALIELLQNLPSHAQVYYTYRDVSFEETVCFGSAERVEVDKDGDVVISE